MKELKSVGLHMQSNSSYIIPHVMPNLNGLISISIVCQVICQTGNILHFHWSIIFNLHGDYLHCPPLPTRQGHLDSPSSVVSSPSLTAYREQLSLPALFPTTLSHAIQLASPACRACLKRERNVRSVNANLDQKLLVVIVSEYRLLQYIKYMAIHGPVTILLASIFRCSRISLLKENGDYLKI